MATNSNMSIFATKSAGLFKLFRPCLLLALLVFLIFVLASSSCLASATLHENGDASRQLLHLTSNMKTRSYLDEAPNTLLRGRKMRTDYTTATSRNSAKGNRHKDGKTSTVQVEKKTMSEDGETSHDAETVRMDDHDRRRKRSKHTTNMDTVVTYADYGGPRRHPPKNN